MNKRTPIDQRKDQSLASLQTASLSLFFSLCTHARGVHDHALSHLVATKSINTQKNAKKIGLCRGCRLPPRRAGPSPGRGLRVGAPLEARARRRARGRRSSGEAARARGREHAQVSGREGGERGREREEKEGERERETKEKAIELRSGKKTPALQNLVDTTTQNDSSNDNAVNKKTTGSPAPSSTLSSAPPTRTPRPSPPRPRPSRSSSPGPTRPPSSPPSPRRSRTRRRRPTPSWTRRRSEGGARRKGPCSGWRPPSLLLMRARAMEGLPLLSGRRWRSPRPLLPRPRAAGAWGASKPRCCSRRAPAFTAASSRR